MRIQNSVLVLLTTWLGLGFFIGCASAQRNQYTISLAGDWSIRLDRDNVGRQENWHLQTLTDPIQLPGSLQEQGYGDDVTLETNWIGQSGKDKLETDLYRNYQKYVQPDDYKHPFWLTPDKYYKGVAWYQKQIDVPSSWSGKRVVLSLERCHWETTVYLDENLIGTDRSLATPHQYDLGFLAPDRHTLTIRVDNSMIVDVGINAHSVSDHTQSNWNGITGDILLTTRPPVSIDNVKIYPEIQSKMARVVVAVDNDRQEQRQGTLTLQATSTVGNIPQTLPEKRIDVVVSQDQIFEVSYPLGDSPLLWDEFDPNLYNMQIRLETDEGLDERTVTFGMRDFSTNGTRFEINGRPIFLRGTLECSIFPKTAYPPTDPAEWARIFDVLISHGLNHMRFHSWCPPEAAFIAADRKGIYLQVEVDAWANIGQGEPIDTFILEESRRIVDAYGNHPSFTMMAYGNEPGPHGGEAERARDRYLGDFLKYWKERDSRRVYTAAAGWPMHSESEYHNGLARLQMWGAGLNSKINAEPPETTFDLGRYIADHEIPFVGHENGQWCVYPNFDEMPKYTGLLKPKNFEIFYDLLEQNNMGGQANDFFMASGKLQTLCYKADIEAALRTPEFAGFQLLDLHDFPGQGTALVGVLDPFWDSKPYVSPEEFIRFSGATVPLARMDKRTFSTSESFQADIEVAHFGKEPIENARIEWTIRDQSHEEKARGEFLQTINIDNAQQMGSVSYQLDTFSTAQKMNLEVTVHGYGQNDWDFWIYPETPVLSIEGVLVVNSLTDEVEERLSEGATVLLTLNGQINEGQGAEVAVGFSSIFWNTAWTNMQAPHTLGILCDPDNPLFEQFPTEYHTNWQWWDIVSTAQAMILDAFPPELTPSIQLIDTWFLARRLALMFEAKVGDGKLLVTSVDFNNDLDRRIASRQLYASLLSYIKSESFQPGIEVDVERVKDLYE